MRQLSWMFLALLVLAGCVNEVTKEEEKPKVVVEGDAGANRKTWEKDGSKMVLIPAGSFAMGDHLDNMENDLPTHTVELDAFYMDTYEVSVSRYKQFLGATISAH